MIRKAVEQDIDTINNLLTLLIQDERKYNSNINPEFKVTNMYNNKINDDSRLILVYEVEGKVIGYIYGFLDESPVTIYPEATLDALYVEESYRGNGIATELINEFVKWCKENHAVSIEVGVLSKNNKAVNLYRKNKFISYSERLKQII